MLKMAGEARSLNWFDTARELTERWHHQEQIRFATNLPGIMTRDLYHPVLDCFLRGLRIRTGTSMLRQEPRFCLKSVNGNLQDSSGKSLPLGLVDGNPGQVLNQAIGVAISWGLAIVGTLVILKICDVLIGVRVSEDQELEGLDVSMHGEEGYNLEA
jgi:hypothetical protein